MTEEIELGEEYATIRSKPLILKLRSLGAGVEEAEETKITYLEAAFFAERNVLPLKKDQLLAIAARKDPLANEKYEVIKYLRERGYIVRPSLDGSEYLRLHRKGLRPGEDKTYYLIKVEKSGWQCSYAALMPALETASKLRKELAIAIVESGRPIFIKFGKMNFE